eukprot:TRINITY_DN1747_c0_g1_i1.p1 TRINITY_DN1747_c0_g1~~TRINITY_DN1747_c0_g1_i1.p1  ORF type:complete len:563 (-),score=104.09 TRINITY_DN1747_c0_g1_i1:117-1805(-)
MLGRQHFVGGMVTEQAWTDPTLPCPLLLADMAAPDLEKAKGEEVGFAGKVTQDLYKENMKKSGLPFPLPEVVTLRGHKLENGVFVHENDTTCPAWVGLPFDKRFNPKRNAKGDAVHWGVEEWETFQIHEYAMRYGMAQLAPDGSKFNHANVRKEWARHALASSLYHSMGRPEQQWWVLRAEWKLQDVKKRRKDSLALANTAVELSVDIGAVGLNRTIVVPACVSMRFLAEKVLLPALGWAQSYHHFYFMDKRDGTMIGVEASARKTPQDSHLHDNDFGLTDLSGHKQRPKRGSPDQVCAFMHCDLVFLDDTEVLLSDFLRVGRTEEDLSLNMCLIYDLGDRWEHSIRVKKVIPKLPPPGQRLCKVIQGRLAPIPEDHNYQGDMIVVKAFMITMLSYVSTSGGATVMMDSLYPTHMATRLNYVLCCEKRDYNDLKDILDSTNYKQFNIKKWDPMHYDNDAANQRLWQALSTRLSIRGSGGGAPSCKCCQEEMTAPEADKSSVDGCYYCGRSKFCSLLDPKTGVLREGSLQQCAKCRTARFCSRQCQVAAWPQHKLICKKPAHA